MGKWATEGGQVQEESIQSEADVDVERRNPLLFLKDQHRTKMNQAVTLLIFHTIALRPTGDTTVSSCRLIYVGCHFYLLLLNNLIVSEYKKPVLDNNITVIQSAISKGTKSNIPWIGG